MVMANVKTTAAANSRRRKVTGRKSASSKTAVKPSRATRADSESPEGLQIGARVKHARLLAGIRMRELALKVGCTQSMISKIESGRVVPSLQMLQRLVPAVERD